MAVANPMSKCNRLVNEFRFEKISLQQGYITEVQFVNMFMPDGEKLFEDAAASHSATKVIDNKIKKRLSTKPVSVKQNTFTKAENKRI